MTWVRDSIGKPTLVSGQLQKNMWPRWAVNLSLGYGHVILVIGYPVLTGVNWLKHGCPISKENSVNQGCMSLSTCFLEYGRHVARLRHRRCHAYAPTINTASHDNHEKINSWVSFSFLYEYGAPLGELRYKHGCDVLDSCLFYKSNRVLFRCLHIASSNHSGAGRILEIYANQRRSHVVT